jgi:hypothetical protein
MGRIRACELYEQRGSQEDDDLDDWLQAEREIVTTFQHTRPPSRIPSSLVYRLSSNRKPQRFHEVEAGNHCPDSVRHVSILCAKRNQAPSREYG